MDHVSPRRGPPRMFSSRKQTMAFFAGVSSLGSNTTSIHPQLDPAHRVVFEASRTKVDQLDSGVMDVTWAKKTAHSFSIFQLTAFHNKNQKTNRFPRDSTRHFPAWDRNGSPKPLGGSARPVREGPWLRVVEPQVVRKFFQSTWGLEHHIIHRAILYWLWVMIQNSVLLQIAWNPPSRADPSRHESKPLTSSGWRLGIVELLAQMRGDKLGYPSIFYLSIVFNCRIQPTNQPTNQQSYQATKQSTLYIFLNWNIYFVAPRILAADLSPIEDFKKKWYFESPAHLWRSSVSKPHRGSHLSQCGTGTTTFKGPGWPRDENDLSELSTGGSFLIRRQQADLPSHSTTRRKCRGASCRQCSSNGEPCGCWHTL